MGPVSTPPVEQARSIFRELGYTLEGEGAEFRAEREWKRVHVTAVDEVAEPPESGDLRCFVTYRETALDLRNHLIDREPDYDWAIISVGEGAKTQGYEVIHPEQVAAV